MADLAVVEETGGEAISLEDTVDVRWTSEEELKDKGDGICS